MNEHYAIRQRPRLTPISINEYFSQQAFDSERYFTALTDSNALNFLPNAYCGFECKVLRRRTVRCIDSYDSRAVVSLALLERKSVLAAYANKTPIMCINVSRFRYTLQAFEFVARFSDPIAEALDFFVKTDIQQLEEHQRLSTHRIPPNAQFSELLHRLRSSGYEEYVFALAERLNLNVDLVRCENPESERSDSGEENQSCDKKVMFRYTRVTPQISTITATKSTTKPTRAITSTKPNVGVGVITAVNFRSRWFVKVTESPILD